MNFEEVSKVRCLIAEMGRLFVCPICMERIKEPNHVSCGHSFCRVCIEKYIQFKDNDMQRHYSINSTKKCPLCYQKNLSKRSLRPSEKVAGIIQGIEALEAAFQRDTLGKVDWCEIDINSKSRGAREAPEDSPVAIYKSSLTTTPVSQSRVSRSSLRPSGRYSDAVECKAQSRSLSASQKPSRPTRAAKSRAKTKTPKNSNNSGLRESLAVTTDEVCSDAKRLKTQLTREMSPLTQAENHNLATLKNNGILPESSEAGDGSRSDKSKAIPIENPVLVPLCNSDQSQEVSEKRLAHSKAQSKTLKIAHLDLVTSSDHCPTKQAPPRSSPDSSSSRKTARKGTTSTENLDLFSSENSDSAVNDPSPVDPVLSPANPAPDPKQASQGPDTPTTTATNLDLNCPKHTLDVGNDKAKVTIQLALADMPTSKKSPVPIGPSKAASKCGDSYSAWNEATRPEERPIKDPDERRKSDNAFADSSARPRFEFHWGGLKKNPPKTATPEARKPVQFLLLGKLCKSESPQHKLEVAKQKSEAILEDIEYHQPDKPSTSGQKKYNNPLCVPDTHAMASSSSTAADEGGSRTLIPSSGSESDDDQNTSHLLPKSAMMKSLPLPFAAASNSKLGQEAHGNDNEEEEDDDDDDDKVQSTQDLEHELAVLKKSIFCDENSCSDQDIFQSTPEKLSSSFTHRKRLLRQKNYSDRDVSKKPAKEDTVDPGSLCIAATGLSIRQKTTLADFSSKFGISCRLDLDETVSHVIVNTGVNLCALRTLKFVQAVSMGKWIVSIKWIEQCLSRNSLVSPAAFEALDSTGNNGPCLARTARFNGSLNQLFANYFVLLVGSFCDTFPKQAIERILTALGAHVAKVFADLSMKPSNRTRVLVLDTATMTRDQMKSLEGLRSLCSASVVSKEWITDSVSCFQVLDMKPYKQL